MHKRPSRPRRIKHPDYDFNVFINCPFDDEYKPLFKVIIFTIHACGFIARCAQESSTQNIRFSRILDLIGESRYGIHDLCRISLEADVMPRNNMPLELGVFIGCRQYGTPYDYDKEYLVLDSVPHRYKQHITDLGGEDPSIHDNNPESALRCVRDWLVYRASPHERKYILGASILYERFLKFESAAESICRSRGLVYKELLFPEYVELVTDWLNTNLQKMHEFDNLIQQALEVD